MRITVFVSREDPEIIAVYKGFPSAALKKFAKDIMENEPEAFPTIKDAKEHIEGWYRWDDFIV